MASSPDSQSTAFAEQFRQIRQAFILGLAKRETEIVKAHDRENLTAALHRLAGSAGAFGFDELSQLAQEALNSSHHDNKENLLKNISDLQHAMREIRAHGCVATRVSVVTVLPHF